MDQAVIPSAIDLLRAAIRCDMAYMEPSWMARDTQVRVTVEGGIQYLSTAGTNSGADVRSDIEIGWVTRSVLGVVRKGFADAWDPLRDAGPGALGLSRDLPVVLNAHSLGVPVAQYFAVTLLNAGFAVLGGAGFGSPTGWDKDGGLYPDMTWWNVKNGHDPVAGRPWLLWPGTAGGQWLQIDDDRIREGMRHPARRSLLPWRDVQNHLLDGPRGYIETLGRCAVKAGEVSDWRKLPEVVEWALSVARFNARGRRPLLA